MWLAPVLPNNTALWWKYDIRVEPKTAANAGGIPLSTTLRQFTIRHLVPATMYRIEVRPRSSFRELPATTLLVNTSELARVCDVTTSGGGDVMLHVIRIIRCWFYLNRTLCN